jgi:hypothetical protein
MRRQIEELCGLVRETQAASGRAAQAESPRRAQAVYVEAEPVEVLPPEGRAAGKGKSPPAAEAARAAPEASRPPPEQPPKSAAGGRCGSGLSLAELEQQARRELERLGAQGANLFKRSK